MSGPITRDHRLQITNPPQEDSADHILLRNSETNEVGSVSKTIVFQELQTQIDEIINPDMFLKTGEINLTGNTVSLLALDFEWRKNNIIATNAADFSTVIAAATNGFYRLDSIYGKTDGTFVKIQGTEDAVNPLPPDPIPDGLLLTNIPVFGAVISAPTPTPPSPGNKNISPATDTAFGTVKTDIKKANPIVYVKETIDNLLTTKANTFTAIKLITGISYDPILDDIATELLYEGTLPMNVVIPTNATVPFPVGTSFYTLGSNTGVLSISAAAGVTLKYKVGMSLSSVQNEIRKYTKQGVNTWLIEGSIAASAAIIPGNVYVNSDPAIGNDTTAQLGNPSKPYLTLTAAMAASNSNTSWRNFMFMSAANVYYVNGMFGSGNYLFKSDFNVTISFQNNTLSDNLMPNSSTVDFNIPKGTIDFRSTGSKYLGSWYRINIICDTYRMNNSFALVGGEFNLTCNIAYHDGGYVQGGSDDYVSKITVNKIINTGGGVFFQYGRNYVIDFNECTSNGNFRLTSYSRSGTILHGNYTTTSTDEFAYIESYFSDSLVKILYKKQAKILGNVTFSTQAEGGFYFSGTAIYNSTNGYGLFHNVNQPNQITLENCVFICPKFHAFRGTPGGSLLLINSYIETGLFVWFTESSGATYTTPTVTFKGSNTVYMTGSTANYIATDNYMNTNTMNIKVIGTLKTNGVLQSGVTQNNLTP